MNDEPSAQNTAPTEPAPAQPSTPPVAPPAPAQDEALPLPANWPGAFGIYKNSKAAVKLNAGIVLTAWLLSFLVGGFAEWKLGNGGSLASLIVGSLGSIVLALGTLAGVRGQKMSVGDAFNAAFPLWLKGIGLTLLVTISIIVSFLALIIPFFFVMPRLVLTTYFLVDKKMGVIEAYKASWNASKGHSMKIWGILGVSILMTLLMITIIGIPFSIYLLFMYAASYAVLYEFINKQAPAAPAQPVQPNPVPPTAPPVTPSVS